MPQLTEGKTEYVQGSGQKPYELKSSGGVYSCSCPAWRNQKIAIDQRTCKHLRQFCGSAAEDARVVGRGATVAAPMPMQSQAVAVPAMKTAKTAAQVKGVDVQAVIDNAAREGRQLRPDEKAKIAGPPVLLAHPYEPADDFSVAGWWYSEKLDGVRAYWDGTNFISRQGNIFHAPDWFKRGLPDHPLDGELYMGRGKFQETMSVVRSFDAGLRWQHVQYVCFDMPHMSMTPFEDRMYALRKALAVPEGMEHYFRVLEQKRVDSHDHLMELLAEYEALGAEGLMIRRPGSFYEVGRSHTIYKVKPFKDAEAEVVGHFAGKGRHRGAMGGLHLRMPSGVEFDLGTGFDDAERDAKKFPVGTLVQYSYTELTKDGKPKCAAFLRIRPRE